MPSFAELLEIPEFRLTTYPQLLQRWIAATPKEHADHTRLKTAQVALVDLCFNAMSASKAADSRAPSCLASLALIP